MRPAIQYADFWVGAMIQQPDGQTVAGQCHVNSVAIRTIGAGLYRQGELNGLLP
jgi:hypothetical protein